MNAKMYAVRANALFHMFYGMCVCVCVIQQCAQHMNIIKGALIIIGWNQFIKLEWKMKKEYSAKKWQQHLHNR